MKKHTLALVGAIALAALAPLGLEAGVVLKGGLSWSSLPMTPADSLPFSFGTLQFYTGGLSLSLGLGFVTIQPEVLYVRMGGAYEVDEANSLEFRHNYVQVPLLFKFNVVPAGPVSPFICAGGYGSYLIKSEGLMEIDGVVEKEDLTEDYLRYDYGVVGGAGITFKLPGIALSIEGRYNYGYFMDPAAVRGAADTLLASGLLVGATEKSGWWGNPENAESNGTSMTTRFPSRSTSFDMIYASIDTG